MGLIEVLAGLGALWLFWILGNLVAMALFVPDVPACTGFRIVIPDALHDILSPAEVAAVTAHERGHWTRRHAWTNFALGCVFVKPSGKRRARQELEADDHALHSGHGPDLATALRILAEHSARQRGGESNPFDLWRASRLEFEAARLRVPTVG